MLDYLIEKNEKRFEKLQVEKFFYILRFYFKNQKKYLRKLKILDLGCNNGNMTKMMSKYFDHVVGIDKKIKPKYDFKFIHDDFLQHDFRTNFDVIVCFSFFHHFKKIQPVISKANKVLKKGGLLIVFECNPYNFLSRIYSNAHGSNLVIHKPNNIINSCKCGGFKILLKEYLIFSPSKRFKFLENLFVHIPFGGKYVILLEKIQEIK